MEKNRERSAKMFGHKPVIDDGPIYPSSLKEMIILD
jgi:hypothetical protein